MSAPKDLLLKAVMLGDAQVGKSALINQLITQKYSDQYQATEKSDFRMLPKDELNGFHYQLWDIPGQPKQAESLDILVGTDVGIFVFDITSRASFDYLPSCLEKLKEYSPHIKHLLLVGNKVDLTVRGIKERAVTVDEAREYAEKQKMVYIETTAKVYITTQQIGSKLTEAAHAIRQERNVAAAVVPAGEPAPLALRVDPLQTRINQISDTTCYCRFLSPNKSGIMRGLTELKQRRDNKGDTTPAGVQKLFERTKLDMQTIEVLKQEFGSNVLDRAPIADAASKPAEPRGL